MAWDERRRRLQAGAEEGEPESSLVRSPAGRGSTPVAAGADLTCGGTCCHFLTSLAGLLMKPFHLFPSISFFVKFSPFLRFSVMHPDYTCHMVTQAVNL